MYGEFIREASKLFADTFGHALDDPAKLVPVYAIVGMIRLFGQPRTLAEAEAVMRQTGVTYFAPNKKVRCGWPQKRKKMQDRGPPCHIHG